MTNRRDFLKKTSIGAAGIAIGVPAFSAKSYKRIMGANERINLGVIGLRGRGGDLLNSFADMYNEGVYIKTLCDVDSQFFNARVSEASKKQDGNKPGTTGDMRNVFDDKDIDAVIVATPNHWHALATIWACQAGKHVYVEKPCAHNVFEGRKMVQAARKYNRIVQVGFQNRSISNVMQAMNFLHDGGIGEVFQARGLCFKPRDSFGIAPDSMPPENLNYDMWLGPAQYRPYNEKRVHYNWHWHWDTGNGDTGNQGPHQFDIARWGLNKKEHPVKIQSMGGIYGIDPDECSQETPNTQTSVFEYADGKLLEFETRGRYTNGEAETSVKIGNLFYGTEGWMEINGSNWKAYKGRDKEPFAGSGMDVSAAIGGDTSFRTAPDSKGHFGNFIDGLRSQNRFDLNCDIETGFMSTALPLIANIAMKVGTTLRFDDEFEKFIGNEEANMQLTRNYRAPYVVPGNV
jgi:predicted dehydrogenase